MKIHEIITESRGENFKRWFGNSKVVDGAGRPLVMYHSTTSEFSVFRDNQRGVHFVSPSKTWVEKFYKNSDGSIADGANVMPVYVSAKNPFDFQNKNHVETLARAASLGSLAINQIKKGLWSRLEDRTTLAVIKRLGFDGLYVLEDGNKNLAIFNPTQIKSATGNNGEFNPNNPDITKE